MTMKILEQDQRVCSTSVDMTGVDYVKEKLSGHDISPERMFEDIYMNRRSISIISGPKIKPRHGSSS